MLLRYHIKVESGSNTSIGEGSAATTVTETRTPHVRELGSLGGKEVRDGETIQWNANWERGAATFVSNSTAIDKVRHTVFTVTVVVVNFCSYRELMVTMALRRRRPTTMPGTKLAPAGVVLAVGMMVWHTITNTSTNYNGPDWEWLGGSWSDADLDGNVISSGSNFETVVEKYTNWGTALTSAWAALATEFIGLLMLMVH